MRRSTVVMLIILVLLAGLYWYMQQPENVIKRVIEPTATATAVDLGYIVSPDKGPVLRISIESADGKTISLDKTTGVWFLLTSESNLPAEPTAADAASSAVTALRIVTKPDPAPAAATIGLDKPAYKFALLQNDHTALEFKVGAMTVTQSGYYVQTTDGSVYIVGAANINSLIALLENPPYLQTPTPSPLPATETPVPTATPAPSATPEPALSPTATP